MEKYLYLKSDNNAVFFKYLNNKNIKKYYILSEKNIIYKILRKFKIINKLIYGNWKNKLKKIDYVILGDTGFDKSIPKYIKNKNPYCKIIFYYWNIVDNFNKYILNDNNIDEFWTFDKKDAELYNLNYNAQFFTNKIPKIINKIEIDVLFLGRAKDRKNFLVNIEQSLLNLNIKTKFIIIEKEKTFVEYEEYIKLVSKSKVIFDFCKKGQLGLTLRPLEALFLEKKLITNNEDIKNYDFYNPNNIFILGVDNFDNIKEFINSPYEKIDQKIIDYYDFDSWLARFEGK